MSVQSKREVVITGIGIISQTETGWENGRLRPQWSKPFDAAGILGNKGLKYFSGTAKLAMAAAVLAAEDAGLPEGYGAYSGVVVGTSYGNLNSCMNFYKAALEDGEAYVNPMDFPNTMITMTAGQIAIRLCLKALNKTISTGMAAGLDALCYAKELIEAKQADVIFAGAAEEILDPVFTGGNKISTEQEESVFLVLEEKDHAIQRKANIYASFLGYGSCYCGQQSGMGISNSIHTALRQAAESADWMRSAIRYLITVAGLNMQETDQERAAVCEIIGGTNAQKPVDKIAIPQQNRTGVTGLLQVCRGMSLAKNKECFLCNSFASRENCTSVIFESMR